MNGGSSLAQVSGLLARVDRQQLSNDADGNLLGPVGAHIQPHGPEHSIVMPLANLPKNFCRAPVRS
jgi:hypothetical protein